MAELWLHHFLAVRLCWVSFLIVNVQNNTCLFKGEKINASDLKNVLGDMGIEVNDKEHLELLKLLPVDGELHLDYCDLQSIEFYGSIYDVYTLKCHVFIFTCPHPTALAFL